MGVSETMKALADQVRREILVLLRQGEKSAGEIAAYFHMTAAAMSYHLARLRGADLVYERRVKNFIYYGLNTSVLEEAALWLCQFGAGAAPEREREEAGQ